MIFNWEKEENGNINITITPENEKTNFKKILTWGIFFVGMGVFLPTCIALGIKHNNTKKGKRFDEKLEQFSDIPNSPYGDHFNVLDTMKVVEIQKVTNLSGNSINTHATCMDKNGHLVSIDADNGHRWHGGIAFVNQGDDVVVGTDRYFNDKHIVEDLTQKEQAKRWLMRHKSVKNLDNPSDKLCYVVGEAVCIYNNDTAFYTKCVKEDGTVIVAEAYNPTKDDAVTQAEPGDEVIIRQKPLTMHIDGTPGLPKGKILSVVSRQH